MQNLRKGSFIIGSHLVLTMAMAPGSRIHARFAPPSVGKQIADARTNIKCDALRELNRKLLEDMKARGTELAADAARIMLAPDRDRTDMATMLVEKAVEQQIVLHSRMKTLLDEMAKFVESGGESSGGSGMG